MKRILCSTGALIGRSNGRDYRLLTGLADKIDCDGFELLMYDDWYSCADALSECLNAIGKPFPSFHIEKDVGELISRNDEDDSEKALELFEKNCIIARSIGSEKLVLHLWNGVHSDKAFLHNMKMYAPLRDIAVKYGLLLTVENVVCNYSDPMSRLKELLYYYPDIAFTFDTKMAEFHGQLLDICKDENRAVWDHVAHLHINDYKGGIKDWSSLKTLHIGEGQIDFKSLFSFVNSMGYDGDITIESTSFGKTTGIIDADSMNSSIARVRELFGGRV